MNKKEKVFANISNHRVIRNFILHKRVEYAI